jgi:hypothetical protein
LIFGVVCELVPAGTVLGALFPQSMAIKTNKSKKIKKPAMIFIFISDVFLTGAPQLGHIFALELTSFLHS